jgi:hypothetical protein
MVSLPTPFHQITGFSDPGEAASVCQRRGDETRLIFVAYRQYGYWLYGIAEHLDVHYAKVSWCLKQAEQANV